MKMLKFFLIFFVLFTSCSKEVGLKPYCESHPNTFEKNIHPIVLLKCSNENCHSAQTPIFGDYATYTAIKTNINKGSFKRFVFDLKIMPPNTYEQLNEEELKLIQCWLDNGAPNN